MLDPLKWLRRKRLRNRTFPEAFRAVLERNFALYRRLSEADREELERLIQVFIAEKRFEGCGGLEVTDEIRVVIAAQACLLLLHRDTDVYPRLVTILVYPSAYVARVTERVGYGVVAEGEMGRLGEAWQTGVVVLSWDHAQSGAADVQDGRNVTLHEFAHQLDQEDGASDGAPVLPRRSMYVAWARVLGSEYAALRRAAEEGNPTLLNPYGATNPAEFFAVATETFFQMPKALKRRHPALYGELQRFYRQDPLSWQPEGAG